MAPGVDARSTGALPVQPPPEGATAGLAALGPFAECVRRAAAFLAARRR
jgi:hypothetical protein